MLKRFLKDTILIFLMVATFAITTMSNVFALADYAVEQNYTVKTDNINGDPKFESSLPGLRILPWTGGSINGDLSIELGNTFCLIYTALYIGVMFAPSATVKATATATLLAAAATIYGVSAVKYRDFEICGADWLVWGNDSDVDISALQDIKEYYPQKGAYNGSKKYKTIACLNDISKCDKATRDFLAKDGNRKVFTIRDRVYRERLYDGEEVVNTGCTDPREERKTYDVPGTSQLYYMRGYDPGNYACDRFLIYKQKDGDEFDEAYQCCVKASDSVCITDKMGSAGEIRDKRNVFCSSSSQLCFYDAFIFEIFKGEEDNKYCARTYSLCPYNFNIQKGTEIKMPFEKTITMQTNVSDGKPSFVVTDACYDEDNEKSLSCQNQIKNFYQYNRHCTTVEKFVPKGDDTEHYAPFIDKACINFVGSSHNTAGYLMYTGYLKRFKDYKSFSAPMAECISETMKNFLFNRAGHTKCVDDNELPDIYGKCTSGVEYTEGDDLRMVKGMKSPTLRLLEFIHTLIMLSLTLMITLYGYNILISGGKMDRKDMMLMFLKLVIVVSFSASTWWYEQLFQFTYGFSNTFSEITGKMGFDTTQDSEGNYIKYDGCYFGDMRDIIGVGQGMDVPNIEDNHFSLYPASRRYVAFFDALDCKVTKYLGYGVGLDAPNLITLLAVSYIWPFNIGLFVAVGTLMLALFVINFVIKAVYIFVASALGLAIMLYVAPLIIPCILFKKTNDIFNKWLKNVISFALQPMILFAYTSIAILIMDKYTLGEGIMVGNGPNRNIICGYSCIDSNTGTVIKYINSRNSASKTTFTTECGAENKVVDLKRNSVLCFLNNITSSPVSLLQSIGLFIPMLVDVFLSDVIMFLRVAFLFFILTKVLNTVPAIATALVGGTKLPSTSKGDPFEAAGKIFKLADNIKRGAKNFAQKVGGKLKNIGGNSKNRNRGSDDRDDSTKRSDGSSLSGISAREDSGGGGSSLTGISVRNDDGD